MKALALIVASVLLVAGCEDRPTYEVPPGMDSGQASATNDYCIWKASGAGDIYEYCMRGYGIPVKWTSGF